MTAKVDDATLVVLVVVELVPVVGVPVMIGTVAALE